MNVVSYAIPVVVAVVLIYAIVVYNRLVMRKNNVKKAWSNVDVLLKQRHDELPKLVETCRQYMQHERTTLERVIQARSRVAAARETEDVGALGTAEGQLRAGLGRLFAVAENYPDLKANQDFLHLEERITGLENTIADRREFYNESANVNNIGIEQFPEVLIARFFNFQAFHLLHFEESEKADVDMHALFQS